MRRRLGLGTLVGVVAGVSSWRGNRTPQLVSIFPDGASFLVMSTALWLALRFERGYHTMLPASTVVAVAASAGVTFGVAMIALGARRFGSASATLLAPLFLVAFASCLAVGVLVTLASRIRAVRAGLPAVR